jgi:hypothetical protein
MKKICLAHNEKYGRKVRGKIKKCTEDCVS